MSGNRRPAKPPPVLNPNPIPPRTAGRKAIGSWVLYDFANSGFAATVLAVVFNVYFARAVVPAEGLAAFGRRWSGESLWSFAVALSTLAIFLAAPLLGAVADLSGRKKTFLGYFWGIGSCATAALVFVTPGRVGLGVALFALANIGFAGGNVFYNALLPGMVPPDRQGRLSGLGWAVGYLGSFFCLALNLAMIQHSAWFGIPAGNHLPVRLALFSVGAWWLLFGWPVLVWGPQETAVPAQSVRRWAALGWAQLRDTFRRLPQHKNLARFMAAFAVYNDGIETLIVTASLVGAGLLGMGPGELIRCFLMIQAVAFFGALLFGRLADRWGNKQVILFTLVIYLGVVGRAYFLVERREFWILGIVLGLVLGGSQAASRSLMSRLTPVHQSAEFFSFYGIVAKFTAVLGPVVFGLAADRFGLRGAILSLAPFFLIGGLLLMTVKNDAPIQPADSPAIGPKPPTFEHTHTSEGTPT